MTNAFHFYSSNKIFLYIHTRLAQYAHILINLKSRREHVRCHYDK